MPGLNARERAVIEALLPSGAHPRLPRGALESGFEAFFERLEREAAPSMRWGLRAALAAAGWASPLLIGRLPPFERLDPARRAAALEALGRSRVYPLRQSLLLLKAAVCLHYGADPEVRRAVGYPS